MAEYSQTQFAKSVGVTCQRVNKIIRDGKLILNENKKIDTKDSRNADAILALQVGAHNRNSKNNPTTGKIANGISTKNEADLKLQIQKVRKEEKNNKILDIQLLAAQKKLISSDIVSNVVKTVFMTFFELLINQYPANITDEIINIVENKGDNARTDIIEKITNDLRKLVDDSLAQSQSKIKIEFKKMENFNIRELK